MQRPPSSTAISRVASGCRIDNKLATELADRLRRIISPRQYPFYVLLETAAFRLGEKQQLSYFGESRPDKVRPAYKTITALTLGARSYEEIETLDLLTDEALSPRQLGFRRDEQAVHLERALLPFVGEVSDFDNDNLAAYTRVFVEIWQPSAKEFDPVDELLTTPGALNEVSFKEVCEVLESHCLGPALPPVKALFKGLAFAVQCFYRGLRVGQLPLHVHQYGLAPKSEAGGKCVPDPLGAWARPGGPSFSPKLLPVHQRARTARPRSKAHRYGLAGMAGQSARVHRSREHSHSLPATRSSEERCHPALRRREQG